MNASEDLAYHFDAKAASKRIAFLDGERKSLESIIYV